MSTQSFTRKIIISDKKAVKKIKEEKSNAVENFQKKKDIKNVDNNSIDNIINQY